MKKIPLIAVLLVFALSVVAYAAISCFQVEVDQDTKMYIGDDTTYTTILAGTKEFYGVAAKNYRFEIASSAATSTPNLRIKVMGREFIKDAATKAPLQMFAPSKTYNYYLTKSATLNTTTGP